MYDTNYSSYNLLFCCTAVENRIMQLRHVWSMQCRTVGSNSKLSVFGTPKTA